MYVRKGNLKFSVTQDNSSKTILIDDFVKAESDKEGDYFGFTSDDVVSKDFREILPEEIQEIIDDNVEFTFEGFDLKEVLDKVINFKVKNSKGLPVDMNAYIERMLSTSDKLSFEVVMERKIFLRDKIKEILSAIPDQEGIYDDATSMLADKHYVAVLDDVMDFLYDAMIESVFLIVSVEGFTLFRRESGMEKTNQLLAKTSDAIKTTFRTRDICGYLGAGRFGVMLVKTPEEDVKYPLARLESNLKKNGVISSGVSFNARFEKADLSSEAMDMIDSVRLKEPDMSLS